MSLLYFPVGREDTLLFNAALHRVRTAESGKDLVFGSVDKFHAKYGVQFEACAVGIATVRGRIQCNGRRGWKMECWGELAREVAWVDVCVACENGALLMDRVVGFGRRRFCLRLEDIPEEMEIGCDCCMEDSSEDDEELKESEAMAWAVDLGLWAVCLGLGFLVSRASFSSSLKRRRSFFSL